MGYFCMVLVIYLVRHSMQIGQRCKLKWQFLGQEWAGWYVRPTAGTLRCHQENNGLVQKNLWYTYFSWQLSFCIKSVIRIRNGHYWTSWCCFWLALLFGDSDTGEEEAKSECILRMTSRHFPTAIHPQPNATKARPTRRCVCAIRNWSKLRASICTVARNVHLNQDCVDTSFELYYSKIKYWK